MFFGHDTRLQLLRGERRVNVSQRYTNHLCNISCERCVIPNELEKDLVYLIASEGRLENDEPRFFFP